MCILKIVPEALKIYFLMRKEGPQLTGSGYIAPGCLRQYFGFSLHIGLRKECFQREADTFCSAIAVSALPFAMK